MSPRLQPQNEDHVAGAWGPGYRRSRPLSILFRVSHSGKAEKGDDDPASPGWEWGGGKA